jgi:AraC-like DNA-binding protein
MQSWMHTPCPPLDQYIEYFFLYENAFTGHSRERFLPDGHIELIIDLRAELNFWCRNDDFAAMQVVQRGWISGVHRRYITIEAAQGASMLVVRFRPGRIRPFLDMPAGEIAGQVVPLDAVWGAQFDQLRTALLEHPEPARRFAFLEAFFLQKIQTAPPPNPVIDFALRRLQKLDAHVGISAIVEKTGYSHKHFVALFHNHIGVPPKVYSRILKFQEAVRQLELAREPDWTALAYSCDYYDQAHFINEFKAFSGFSPSFYLEKRGVHLNYLPVE